MKMLSPKWFLLAGTAPDWRKFLDGKTVGRAIVPDTNALCMRQGLQRQPFDHASLAEHGDKHQNLVADRGEQFFDAADQNALTRHRHHFLIKIAAASLLAHGILLLGFILPDLVPARVERLKEIPVEVVIQHPIPEKKPPPAAGAAEKSSAPHPDAPPQPGSPREVQDKRNTEANSKPKNPTASEPNHPANPAAPKAHAKSESEPPVKAAGRGSPESEIPRNTSAAQKPAPSAPSQDKTIQNSQVAGAGFTLPFDSGPEIFRAVAVPLPTEGGSEAMSYKMIVFGILARVKHYPETAIKRGAKGAAAVGFILDDAGQVRSVSLLRSSGEADLDAESVELVRRAAPFPPPPPGAQHSFAAEVSFNLKN
jgi:periplasmic protein TonB